jgi:hypothetical protein
MRRWYTAIAFSVAAAAAQATPPARIAIEYDVRHNGTSLATVRHVLEHDGKTYRLTETWEGNGLLSLLGEIRRSSQGQVTSAGLRPLVYEDKRPRRDPARARFDWGKGTVVQEFRGPPRTEPIPAHAQDRLSFFYAPAFKAPAGGRIEYHVVDGKGISHYVLEVAGRERISVPAGEFDALRLVRREDDGKTTELWLDRARSLLPLRVHIVDKDGTRIDQVAARIEPPA